MPKVKIKSLTEGYAFIPGYHQLYYLLIPIEVKPQKFSYLSCTISFLLNRVTEQNCHLSGLPDVTAASLGHKSTHTHSLFLNLLKKPFFVRSIILRPDLPFTLTSDIFLLLFFSLRSFANA